MSFFFHVFIELKEKLSQPRVGAETQLGSQYLWAPKAHLNTDEQEILKPERRRWAEVRNICTSCVGGGGHLLYKKKKIKLIWNK